MQKTPRQPMEPLIDVNGQISPVTYTVRFKEGMSHSYGSISA
ncbi:hypothetical protein [Rhizobium lentis]|uniref:Uncharacterized protein n=1 Tax=Rhizobium lentis TaxID=1138194 RepID=A0A7W8XI84_9HYPH|nr:hypothetical protein [Rhizobium lentis]MBB4576368.1 hypothetical protein [Rhizobium lentis]MBB5552765.1 hypothetical protein [Rhizobium lentis]MBB5563305.1 hypothetical protein [Rhizobium lentis]MBB5569582.1 hypothetical protein [Rhizobium lentis]